MTEYIYGFEPCEKIPEMKMVQREEIVRCRDCAYMFDWAYGRPLCKLWAFNDQDESESSHGNALYPKVELDGYCAWGERKEGSE